MSMTLEQIAKLAREHTATPEERRAQRLSLITGLRSYKSTLSREKVSHLVDQLEGRAPSEEKEKK